MLWHWQYTRTRAREGDSRIRLEFSQFRNVFRYISYVSYVLDSSEKSPLGGWINLTDKVIEWRLCCIFSYTRDPLGMQVFSYSSGHDTVDGYCYTQL